MLDTTKVFFVELPPLLPKNTNQEEIEEEVEDNYIDDDNKGTPAMNDKTSKSTETSGKFALQYTNDIISVLCYFL